MAGVMVGLWMGLGFAAASELAATREAAARLVRVGLPEQGYALLVGAAADHPEETGALELEAGALLWDAGRFELAVGHFDTMAPSREQALGLAWSHYRLEAPGSALQSLAGVDGPAASYLAGWCYLAGRDTTAALDAWATVAPPLDRKAADLGLKVGTWKRLPRRSPTVAGLLSAALPGAGQVYVGRWLEAPAALVVNGLLLAAGWQLYEREQWFGLGLVGALEFGFYGGNITSAVAGARRFNRRVWTERVAPLETAYGLRLEPSGGSWVVE